MTFSPVSKKQQHGKKKKKPIQSQKKILVNYICLACNETEQIPLDVVRNFDAMDDGDPTVPSQFTCEECGGEMYPEYYKGIHGIEYKISVVRK